MPDAAPSRAPDRAGDRPWRVVRVPAELRLSAASRLVSQSGGQAEAAGKKLLESAPSHGIDVSLMWATVDQAEKPGRRGVRQACLLVPSCGRTAMLFLSEPAARGESGEEAAGERAALASAACEHAREHLADRVRLVQALPDPGEAWATAALQQAGFMSVGRLLYLRRPASPQAFETRAPAQPQWPSGVDVVRADAFTDASARDRALVQALDRTYEATLDCPELCGLRRTEDILASHRGTGQYDPALWWVVLLSGQPHGCMLFSRCPDTATTELVYLGLSPQLRGKGMGATLLALGLRAASSPGPDGLRRSVDIACAVDRRNTPALALYDRAGFKPFAERVALVRAVEDPAGKPG